MGKIVFFLLSAMCAIPLSAQTFCGEHKFDGQHRNEVSGYVMAGTNVVTKGFGGISASYKRHLTDRWNVEGKMQMQFGKQLYSMAVQGGYRLPVGFSDFYFDGKLMWNGYARNSMQAKEYVANLSVTWETPYVDLKIGESLIKYNVLGYDYTEPLTFTFGVGVNIRPRWNSWNLGIFFRNYDEFYYENWNINWGFRFNANLPARMKLFGEFNVRPAGSMSQLASKYEASGKLGLKYTW